MGTIDQIDNGAAVILAEIGDDCTITPRASAGISRKAIFTRELPALLPGHVVGEAPSVQIEIADDATNGVTAITFGADSITVPAKHGGRDRAYPIAEFLDHSGGFWRVRVFIDR